MGYFIDEKDKNSKVLQTYFELESSYYEQHKDMSIEIKSATIWGMLTLMQKSGIIDWSAQKRMYGDFMSHIMGIR